MNINVEIKTPELAAAIHALAAAMGNRQLQDGRGAPLEVMGSTLEIAVVPEKPAKPAAKKPTTTPTPEPETAGEKATPEPSPASSSSDDASAVDYGQVKAAVMQVSKDKGRDAAVALLAEFDAKVGGDLKEEQWSTFVARAAEVLG